MSEDSALPECGHDQDRPPTVAKAEEIGRVDITHEAVVPAAPTTEEFSSDIDSGDSNDLTVSTHSESRTPDFEIVSPHSNSSEDSDSFEKVEGTIPPEAPRTPVSPARSNFSIPTPDRKGSLVSTISTPPSECQDIQAEELEHHASEIHQGAAVVETTVLEAPEKYSKEDPTADSDITGNTQTTSVPYSDLAPQDSVKEDSENEEKVEEQVEIAAHKTEVPELNTSIQESTEKVTSEPKQIEVVEVAFVPSVAQVETSTGVSVIEAEVHHSSETVIEGTVTTVVDNASQDTPTTKVETVEADSGITEYASQSEVTAVPIVKETSTVEEVVAPETPEIKMDSIPPIPNDSLKSSKSEDTLPPIPPVRRPSFMRKTPEPVRKANTLPPKPMPRRQSKLNFPTLQRVTEELERKSKKKRGMFSWLGGDSSKKKNKEVLDSVSEGLRKIYKQKLYPLEEHYKFHEFHSPALDDPDFDAKPMILLVGQYSTGKTTFIRYLLEQDFPGIRIGPEPTTDRFIAVMHGEEEGCIPGNALVVDAKKQFRALSGFGNAFLNRFQCSTLNNQVLESVTIVDTPGILSGEKQRIDRGYDFTGVLEWFAERVDRIILLFDAHKLDISDEFKRCIEALAGNEDKIRIVLNKSDMVDHQQLMRVYGALMWSLGKVFKTPEVSRVYLGSFWDHPLHYDINRRLFQDEQHDLFADLQALPRNAALRKLNDLIKRARLAKVHAFIIAELRKQMPSMIGKEKKKKELIQNLDKIYEQLQREHNISPGDFPDVHKMRERLASQDFTKFQPIKPKLLEVVDGMLASDIARLMAQIPKEEAAQVSTGHAEPSVKGGAFSQAQEAETPFGFGRGEGFDKGADESEWVVNRERSSADTTFDSLGPVNGFISGRTAKEHMVKSKLPNSVLGKIWKLADVDKDGQLDTDEFALANYLINLKLEGHELPNDLPKHLIPPAKRGEQDPVYPKLEDEE